MKNTYCNLISIITLFILSFPVWPALEWDTSFDGDGLIMGRDGSWELIHSQSVTIQANGKIVVGGVEGSYFYYELAITIRRYNEDGSPDLSFGTSGEVIDRPTDENNLLKHISVLSNGDILVAGVTFHEIDPIDGFVVRYNSLGAIDIEFRNNFVLDPGKLVYGLAVLSDGSFLIAGVDLSNNQAYIAKYTNTGIADTDFANNGIFSIGLANDISVFHELMVLNDGAILASGVTYNEDSNVVDNKSTVVKLSTNGILDSSFGVNGLFSSNIDYQVLGSDIIELENGKILLLWYDYSNGMLQMLQANGELDIDFGLNGEVDVPGNPQDMLLLPNGKIITADTFEVFGRETHAYNIDGSVNATFNHNFWEENDWWSNLYIFALALQADNKIVAVGGLVRSGHPHNAFIVTRFKDMDVDNDGVMINDNCPDDFNSDQLDTDQDGIGDVCESILFDTFTLTSNSGGGYIDQFFLLLLAVFMIFKVGRFIKQ